VAHAYVGLDGSQSCVDAAYCQGQTSVVCLSVTIVSPAKMAEPIEMPFRMLSWVVPGNHILDGGAH